MRQGCSLYMLVYMWDWLVEDVHYSILPVLVVHFLFDFHCKILVGQVVMANYNPDEPDERGYWYDVKITKKVGNLGSILYLLYQPVYFFFFCINQSSKPLGDCGTQIFSPRFDVFCDLLLNRDTWQHGIYLFYIVM